MDAEREPRAVLDDPLAEAQDVEHALQVLLQQKSSGPALPAATVASVAAVAEQAAHGTLLSELCADILQGVDVALNSRPPKRQRSLVDAVTHGPQVLRWNSAAEAAAERRTLRWKSVANEAAKTQEPSLPERSGDTERAPRRRQGRAGAVSSLRRVLARGGRGRHVSAQVQALLVHAHRVLQKLGGSRRQRLLLMLPSVPVGAGATRHTSAAARILARLLGMSARTISNHVSFVKRSGSLGKRPRVHPAAAQDGGAAAADGGVADRLPEADAAAGRLAEVRAPAAGLVNLVRVTQFMSTHGLPKALLPNLAYLIRAAGGDVGPSRHHKRFASVAEAAADSLLIRQARAWLNRPLGGTGRLPDLEVFCDGGSIGQYYSRASDQVFAPALASTDS